MRFKYIDYGKNILAIGENRLDTIYVFSDYSLKNSYKKSLERNIFKGTPTLLTLDEFKEKVFMTDKIVLREAKRFISFYSATKTELKELLGMENYYDSIDFADSFFRYYKELNEVMKENLENVQPWQEKYIEKYEILKKKYDEYLRHRNHIILDWIESKENIDLDFIVSYKKIVFIDIMHFTPLEKEMIHRIEQNIPVEFVLQIPKEEFDEKKLSVKTIKLPRKFNNIEVYEVNEEIEELVALKVLSEKNPGDIFSPISKENSFHRILPKYFSPTNKGVLNDTKLYKFIKIQYELLSTLEVKINNALPLLHLKEALEVIEFKEGYELEIEDIKEVYEFLEDDYKYLPLKSCSDRLKRIYEDLIEIQKFRSIDEFVDFFKKRLDLEKFYQEEYKNIFEKFYEAISLSKTSEIMLGEEGFKRCFTEGSQIYKLIIQYMNNIELDRVDTLETKRNIVKDIALCKGPLIERAYFVDITGRTMPGIFKERSIFTEHQRKESGMSNNEKYRELTKHRFYQSILNVKNSTIFYMKNEAKGEDISPFLTEIFESYNIKKEQKIVTKDEVSSILEKSLYKENVRYNFDLKEDHLPKATEDFENDSCKLGAYDYEMLEKCKYKFYFSKLCGISPLIKSWSNDISMKFIGIYVHSILEEITKEMWKNVVFRDNYHVEGQWVEEILIKHFNFNREKIPVYLDNYFKEILIPRFKRNILKFYKELEKMYMNKKINRFESEKVNWENREPIVDGDIKFFITGRVDFIVESSIGNLIIDFKTGKKQDKQLDFYSILLYGDERNATKGIYNVFEGKLEFSDKIELTRETLKETLIEFLKKDIYELSDKASNCSYCDYMEICRRKF